jgi:hypothetical protein
MPPTPADWLLLLLQLPTRPSRARVQAWRRLQRLGAVALKNSAYVLPESAQAREDFAWMAGEIRASGGHASVFVARAAAPGEDDAISAAFRDARQQDYTALIRVVERLRAQMVKRPPRRNTADWLRAAREARRARERLMEIERIDFFGAAGRERARRLLADVDRRLSEMTSRAKRPRASVKGSHYRNRVWVTRPRPGIDRMGSAWLIRRFIDPAAKFAFAPAPPRRRDARVPFDMFGVDFGHQGHLCTFEVLVDRFGIDDPAVAHLARVVHALDLKDDRFEVPDATTVSHLVDGLQRSYVDDHELLEQGIVMFESLYLALANPS